LKQRIACFPSFPGNFIWVFGQFFETWTPMCDDSFGYGRQVRFWASREKASPFHSGLNVLGCSSIIDSNGANNRRTIELKAPKNRRLSRSRGRIGKYHSGSLCRRL
jgi:hypothetical protein